jgi:hypothetical protein
MLWGLYNEYHILDGECVKLHDDSAAGEAEEEE